jgi:class 3 adenylate cyclase
LPISLTAISKSSALSDRKRFLKAVAGLAGLAMGLEPTQAQPTGSTAAQSTSAERRPITVMVCDLVGSTSLAAKLDAEDWRNLVNVYLDEASGAVTALGGHVLKKLGDGLMALFGYPQAQENDAERAVRAALAICQKPRRGPERGRKQPRRIALVRSPGDRRLSQEPSAPQPATAPLSPSRVAASNC